MAAHEDDLGRPHEFTTPPRRIVSLVPSLTETLVHWEVKDRIAGCTVYCVLPKAVVKDIPKIGGTKDPDIRAIRALEPDLVLANAEENRKEDVLAIEAFAPVWVTFPKTVADCPSMLRRLGRAVGAPVAAERDAASIERELDAHRAWTGAPRSRAAYLIWREPWMSINRDTYIHDVLRANGMTNVFGGKSERYFETTLEEIRAAAPDYVILPSEPFPFAARHAREVAAGTGLSIDRVRLAPGEDYCWFGFRTAQVFETHRRLFPRSE